MAFVPGFENDFLVMELVEGETLGERIARGPLPFEEARALFVQIAEGLGAAHDKGVIHRDLKPANVKITPEGRVKILDFGLARLAEPDDGVASAESSQAPTLTRGTVQGSIIGTASYMSPEQARGKAVDKRTDIWAFGCCLYEALTARRAFRGETMTDVLSDVLNREPAWDALAVSTPLEVRKLLRRCLAKETRRRIHDIADARNELDEAPSELHSKELRPGRSAIAAAATLSAVVGFTIAILATRTETMPRPATRLTIEVAGEGLREGPEPPLAISRNGRQVAIAVASGDGASRLYLRTLDQFDLVELPGTEDARLPFFSPDGEWVGFLTQNRLRQVSLSGGSMDIAELPTGYRGASWAPDGTIVLGGFNKGLERVDAGGTATALTTIDIDRGETYHAWPEVMPNGRDVLFTIQRGRSELAVASLETGEWRPLSGTEDAVQPRYLESGHLVYGREDSLFAQPFDARHLELTGSPTRIAGAVNQRPHTGLRLFDFDVARNGALVYAPATHGAVPMMLVERSGREEPLGLDMRGVIPKRASFSPDGRFVAVPYTPDPGVPDIWIHDLERDSLTRFTANGRNIDPVWTPDGSRIAFASFRADSFDIYWKPADGSAEAEPLLTRDYGQYPVSFSPDGKFLAFAEVHPVTGRDIWILLLAEQREATPVLATRFAEEAPAFSPDGRFLAFQSDESGRDEVYVQPYPGPGGKWKVSTGGGEEPAWSPDGKELFFRATDTMMVVAVDTKGEFTSGVPEVLFPWRFAPGDDNLYDVSPKGDGFVMSRDERPPLRQLSVVLDWTRELPRP